MSRGGRRRSGRGRRSGQKPPRPASEQGASGLGPAQVKTQSSGRSRRRRRGAPGPGGLRGIIDTMVSRPGKLQTLPPDGIVLEELIADLEEQYGTPATPQEYRLVVKVASPEERASGAEEGTQQPGEEAEKAPSGRRRRRASRRQARKKSGEAPKSQTPAP